MIKTDAHMAKVKNKLLQAKAEQTAIEERQKQRYPTFAYSEFRRIRSGACGSMVCQACEEVREEGASGEDPGAPEGLVWPIPSKSTKIQ
jgi:hypothetical protein